MLVEHSSFFLSRCDRHICIGPVGGKNGGYIIDENFKKIQFKNHQNDKKFSEFINIKNINLNNVKNQTINFPKNAITAIIGKSGSGKTSIAKFMQENLKNVIYITQKPLKGNIRSSVASYLQLNKVVADIYAEHFKFDYKDFMPNNNAKFACQRCNATGVVKFERGFEDNISIVCPECEGMLFSQTTQSLKIENQSISDIYNSEISSLNFENSKILKFKNLAQKLSLSHLSLNRKIQTLSGGEAKRLRLLEILLNSRLDNKILIIDELGAGLDDRTCFDIMRYLQEIQAEAILIIEHKPLLFLQSDFIIEIGPGSGKNGGRVIFQDKSNEYYEHHKKIINFELRA